MDRPTLYDDDIYAWAEQQAAVLRRLAETGRNLPNELDLENLAEEIEDVGKSQLHAAENLLMQTMIHLIKAYSDPASRARRHWLAEALGLQWSAQRAFAPSMRRLIDVDDLWRGACRVAQAKLVAYGIEAMPPLPVRCPFTLEELIADEFDSEAALLKLGTNGKE